MAEIRVPDNLLYTEEHEYVMRVGDDEIIVGITDYAQGELSDVVFVELPEVGSSFARMEAFGTIEAVKAVSDLYSPVSGEITEVNEELTTSPEIVKSSPYEKGWMVKIKMTNTAELDSLLKAADYKGIIGE